MVRQRKSMDLLRNNNIRMETRLACDPVVVNSAAENDGDLKISVIAPNAAAIVSDQKKLSSDESNQESNIKLKRCRHGRIIVKDLSKKKPVQRDHHLDHDRVSKGIDVFDTSGTKGSLLTDHSRDNEETNSIKVVDDLKTSESINGKTHPPEQSSNRIVTTDSEAPIQNHPNQEVKHFEETAQLEASPLKPSSARSSPTPSSTNSAPSDIYDPEGPIIPISPGDSPPLSPMIYAANTNSTNNNINNQITYRTDGAKDDDDDVPSSAVQLNQQEKYLQKLNRQERVVEEVKIALKPHYQRRSITKEQYKDVLRRAVPKICHSKNGEINPVKIRTLVDAYVKKMKRRKK